MRHIISSNLDIVEQNKKNDQGDIKEQPPLSMQIIPTHDLLAVQSPPLNQYTKSPQFAVSALPLSFVESQQNCNPYERDREKLFSQSDEQWLNELKSSVTDPIKLLNLLEISPKDLADLQQGLKAKNLFPLRVPMSFIARMEKNNRQDPLLLQVLPVSEEFIQHPDFVKDPLAEQDGKQSGMLHKYKNRVLMMVKNSCAINCRYCFRRHFPYQEQKGNKSTWQSNLAYVKQRPEIDEIILSGGDPLMAKDHELKWLLTEMATIPHVKRVRIHTRLPVVIPSRITAALIELLRQSPLQCIVVTHINHPNEINDELANAMAMLKKAGVTLLNQYVLLKGINDQVDIQVALNKKVFDIGIIPYYLHQLDKVEGATHFEISDDQARKIVKGMNANLSGFMVPKLVRDVSGEENKTLIDLNLV